MSGQKSGRFAVLLSAAELSPALRWRLVSSLFAQQRSLIEGSISLAIVTLICWGRTQWRGFAVLAALTGASTVARLVLAWAFARRVRGARVDLEPEAGRPEIWARRFTAGAVTTAALWGATICCAFVGFRDDVMQMFVIMVAAGWVSAAGARNASSPATVTLQSVLVTGTSVLCAAFAGTRFTVVVAPFAAIMGSATLSIAAYMREQALHMMLAEQRLAAANTQLTQLSATDGLTGIGNRRAFDAALQAEWCRAARERAPLALLLIDVDFFKRYNDRYGHPAGDECLCMIAAALQRTLRAPPDVAARFGGEEFVAILPGATDAVAREVGQRVCKAVIATGMRHQDSPFGAVTVSVGAASLSPVDGEGWKALVDGADGALYRAKNAGRNRVRCASDSRLPPGGGQAAGPESAEGLAALT